MIPNIDKINEKSNLIGQDGSKYLVSMEKFVLEKAEVWHHPEHEQTVVAISSKLVQSRNTISVISYFLPIASLFSICSSSRCLMSSCI